MSQNSKKHFYINFNVYSVFLKKSAQNVESKNVQHDHI